MKKTTNYKYPKYIEDLIEKAGSDIKKAYHEGVANGLNRAGEIMKGLDKKKN